MKYSIQERESRFSKLKRIPGIILMFLLLAAGAFMGASMGVSAAEEAEELTVRCVFTSNAKTKDFSSLTDGNLGTWYPMNDKKGWLEVEAPSPVGGVSVSMADKYGMYPISYDVEIEDGNGEWVSCAKSRYLVDWYTFENPVSRFRLKATSKERIRIAEMRVFGPGEKPEEVQDWKELEKCDMMLLACHPDDEVLWFAGLLPTYAGERGYKVQVAMMTPRNGERQLELLSCVWHCGVRYYPYFIGFHDKHGGSIPRQYTAWKGKNRVMKLVTECFRKYKPEVVVTHGVEGEYGHSAHRVTSEAARLCVEYAAKKSSFPESVKKYGTWQVKKLYLHEYDKNQIVMDWDQPLAAFGGKTGFDVAEEAFQYHATQTARDWVFTRKGEHDNTLFGLYFTAVGEDTGLNDFMENIDLNYEENEL